MHLEYTVYIKQKLCDIQKVILINLSTTEIIIAITAGAGRTLEVFNHGVRNHKESMFLALFYVGVNFVYYLIMIYISIDRLLCILLEPQIQVLYDNQNNTKNNPFYLVSWIYLLHSIILSAI